MLVFKLLKFLFPFIKEMVLGDKTVRQSLLTNKLRVALVVGILFSITLNFLLVPKLLQISWEHVELQKRYRAVQQTASEPTVVVGPPDPPEPDAKFRAVVPGPSTEQAMPGEVFESPGVAGAAHYRATQEAFERIRAREARQKS